MKFESQVLHKWLRAKQDTILVSMEVHVLHSETYSVTYPSTVDAIFHINEYWYPLHCTLNSSYFFMFGSLQSSLTSHLHFCSSAHPTNNSGFRQKCLQNVTCAPGNRSIDVMSKNDTNGISSITIHRKWMLLAPFSHTEPAVIPHNFYQKINFPHYKATFFFIWKQYLIVLFLADKWASVSPRHYCYLFFEGFFFLIFQHWLQTAIKNMVLRQFTWWGRKPHEKSME